MAEEKQAAKPAPAAPAKAAPTPAAKPAAGAPKKRRPTSAARQARKALRRRAANKIRRTALRTLLKQTSRACAAKDPKSQELVRKAFSALDRAASKHLIHRNTAARTKSRLARKLRMAA